MGTQKACGYAYVYSAWGERALEGCDGEDFQSWGVRVVVSSSVGPTVLRSLYLPRGADSAGVLSSGFLRAEP